MNNFTRDEIISKIIKNEGGYVNHPDDRGGPTKYGITLQTLRTKGGKPLANADDVMNLTVEEAAHIYDTYYVADPKFHLIDASPLLYLMVDSGVLHGPRTATKWLQQTVDSPPDGYMGPNTKAALEATGYNKAYKGVLQRRLDYTSMIVRRDHSQAVFIHGWIRRAAQFVDYI